jgi:hypothetical protein
MQEKQALFSIVQSIAAQFPDSSKTRYQQAASTFRIPYWDWAAETASGDYFPNSVGSPKVNVITPQSNGEAIQIDNPLYSYNFSPLNPVSGDFVDLPVRMTLLSIMVKNSLHIVSDMARDPSLPKFHQVSRCCFTGRPSISSYGIPIR